MENIIETGSEIINNEEIIEKKPTKLWKGRAEEKIHPRALAKLEELTRRGLLKTKKEKK